MERDYDVMAVFSLSGVRQSVQGGSPSPGQTFAEADDLLRPCGWLHLCICGHHRLPAPAVSAVAGARQGHGRCHGCHRASQAVEAGAKQWSQCHKASGGTGSFLKVTNCLPRLLLSQSHFGPFDYCNMSTECWMCSQSTQTLFTFTCLKGPCMKTFYVRSFF